MLGPKQDFAPQLRSFALSRESVNEESRTVDLIFSTETDKVERWFGVEILDHGTKSVRMDRLRNKAPLLLDHDTKQQIGVVESAALSGKEGRATVRFSKSKKGEEVFRDVIDGIRSKVSVGYRVHSLILESSDKKTGRDTYRVNDWEPFEVSVVSVPADDGAGIRSSESIFGKRSEALSTNISVMKPNSDNEERSDVPEIVEPPVAPPVIAPEVKAEARSLKPEKGISEDDVVRLANEEANRRDEIRSIGASIKAPEAEIKKAISDKETVEAFKLRAFERLAAENQAFTGPKQSERLDMPEAGTRAATLTAFANAAKGPLAARGVNIIVPDYSKEAEIQRTYIDGSGDQFHRSLTGAVTLIDIAKMDAGIGAPIISEVAVVAPEVRTIPVDIIQGAVISLSVNLTAASVGFRNANEGSDSSIGTFESRIFETQVIDPSIVIDIQGVLNASKDPGRVMYSAAKSVLDGVVKHLGVQTWYGGTLQSGYDAKAAPGLLAQSNTAATHVVDAAGSTAKTSVYMVQLGDTYCDYVWGNGTTLNMGDWMEETVYDSNGKKLRGLVSYLSGRVAPRLANKNSLVRIKNVGTDTDHTLNDDFLFQAYEKFITNGQMPNAIYMTPRSQRQLQSSRTATTTTGTPAPLPTEWNGIPIYVTNSLSLAETV